MRVALIKAPDPIIQPKDVPGNHDGDDARVARLIASAQAMIDGPTGSLNRALGVQTIEVTTSCLPRRLPYRPVIEIVSFETDGEAVAGVTVEVDGRLNLPGLMPHGVTVIRYRAGCDEEKTGPVPANAKAAVSLMVQDLLAGGAEHGGLRSFNVDGAFSEAYNSPDQVQRGRNATVEALLAPLRVFA